MFRRTSIFLIASFSLAVLSCTKKPSPEAVESFNSVIPVPEFLQLNDSRFVISSETRMRFTEEGPAIRQLKSYFGLVGEAKSENEKNVISLQINSEIAPEGYVLKVESDRILIEASGQPGFFYGVQTLCQLAVRSEVGATGSFEVAGGTIRDKPLYPWRGAMLDVARHFFNEDDVKHMIDGMAMHKLNVLHLHLTDDQGWRIEISTWPRLTTTGGATQVGGGGGGFYTKEQYRDIVKYAADRFITVVPEVDMPGHINSALASYGELNSGIQVPREGQFVAPSIEPLGKGPAPTPLYQGIEVGFSTLRAGKPESFRFVGDVLKELAELTPGQYLHVGGDEAHVTPKADYLKFVNFFKATLDSLGKKMIGWEEIAQGDLDSTTTIQFWKSEDYAKLAASKGAHIIMSPSTRVYLDMKYDSTTRIGLNWAAYIEVDDAYNWQPEQEVEGIDVVQIKGIEAPLWGETLKNRDDMNYMLYPRLTAIAELAWSPIASRSWDSYRNRLAFHGKRLTGNGIVFYRSPLIPWK